MKISTSFLGIFAVATMFVACKDSNNATTETVVDHTTSTDTPAKMETASFSIDGMSCAIGCAKTIESKVANMEGVQEAKVDYDTKTATVKYDASKQSPEKIVETVEGVAGGKLYKVSNVSSTADQAMNYNEPKKEKKKKSKKGSTGEAKSCSKAGKKECCMKKAESNLM